MYRFAVAVLLIACGVWAVPALGQAGEAKVTRYARFQAGDTVAYGIVEGSACARSRETCSATGSPLSGRTRRSGFWQVLGLAGNYKSHLGGGEYVTTVTTTTKVTTNVQTGRTTADSQTKAETEKPGEVPEKFRRTQLFFKSPSCLIPTGEPIVIPPGTSDVHFEAELVVVIGRRTGVATVRGSAVVAALVGRRMLLPPPLRAAPTATWSAATRW